MAPADVRHAETLDALHHPAKVVMQRPSRGKKVRVLKPAKDKAQPRAKAGSRLHVGVHPTITQYWAPIPEDECE